jgi:hypothetical protein
MRRALLSSLPLAILVLGISFPGPLGCGSSSGGGSTPTIALSETAATIDQGQSSIITASTAHDAGEGVSWAVSGGGTLSGSSVTSVTYNAPATVTSATVVTITATSNKTASVTASITVTVEPAPAIATATGALASGTIGTAYSATLASTGGVAPLMWTIVSGTLPAGLSLNATTGAITGTPTAAGTSSVTFRLTDSGAPPLTATVTVSITIAGGPAISFTTASLAGATVGVAYSASVAATGGVGTLTYTLASGALPAGLSLSTSGSIAGTPTAGGTSTFTVKATDIYGDSGTSGSLSITVVGALAVTTLSLPNGAVGTAYSQTLTASGGSGTGYTWSITSGASSLSAVGLSLTGASISGTPTAGGTATFTVQVTDSASNKATANFSIVISSPLAVTTTSIPSGTVGSAYSTTLAASGGTGTYSSWTVLSGTGLSAVGLTLSSNGTISGTPTAAETATAFAVQVTDSGGNKASANLTITVTYATLSITSTNRPNATVGTPYSVTFTASGGSGHYTWALTSGSSTLQSLGISLNATTGLLSGTPFASGSYPYTVQVTDTVTTRTSSAPYTLLVAASTLSITNTNLPNATVGTPYSFTFNVTGGSGHYSWALTAGASALQSIGMSLNATTGVLSGSPSASGSYSYTVQVTDTVTTSTAIASYVLLVTGSNAVASCTHDGSGNSILSGNYAFLLSGYDPNGNKFDAIGDFKADGAGTIKNGNGDVNSSGFATSGEQNYTFSGTYSIGSTDYRGMMSVTNTNTSGTGLPSGTAYCFASDTIVGGVAESGRIVEADGSGFVLTGYFEIQNPADFTASAISGGYVLGLQGVAGNGSGATARAGLVGQVQFSGSGGITSGQVDAATYNPGTASTTYQSAIAIQSSGSSYSISSTTGRGILTLNSTSGAAGFVIYPVGTGNKLFLLSLSDVNTNTLFSGEAIQQTASSFTTANVKSTSVFRSSGADPSKSPATDFVQVGQLSLDGNGNLSATLDANDGGTVSGPSISTATYSVSPIGYLTLGNTGSNPPRIYLSGPGSGFALDSSQSVSLYYLAAQTVPSGGFTATSMSGNYAIGTISPAAYSNGASQYPQIFDGFVSFSPGTVTITEDAVSVPGLSSNIGTGLSVTDTYALDLTYGATTGRVIIQQGGSASVVGYIVSTTQVFAIQTTPGKDGLTFEGDHQ